LQQHKNKITRGEKEAARVRNKEQNQGRSPTGWLVQRVGKKKKQLLLVACVILARFKSFGSATQDCSISGLRHSYYPFLIHQGTGV